MSQAASGPIAVHQMNASHWIDGIWSEGSGAPFNARDALTREFLSEYRQATSAEVDRAVGAARVALPGWAARPIEQRRVFLDSFVEAVRADENEFAEIVARETGKPLWEARTEIASVVSKVAFSVRAYGERNAPREEALPDATARLSWKPIGVAAVFGPFNMPAHLPNGHIVPALLAGNTVVLKPSELTPAVAERMIRLWERVALPPGVLNLVQGGRATGEALAAHAGIDALFFTGSSSTGQALARAALAFPGRLLALEMGGNNPLIVWDAEDSRAAAYHTVLSAFITAGQRCTCARRLIIPEGAPGDDLLTALTDLLDRVRVGSWNEHPEPFCGPVISPEAGRNSIQAYERLLAAGAGELRPVRSLRGIPNLLAPGLVDVTGVPGVPDEEVFAPLLQITRVRDFDAALAEANRTAYGLAAGLFSDARARRDEFFARIRAGVVNWNRSTTGASGALPFGGVGRSGNFRPGGYFAADYTSYPVAALERETLDLPERVLPGIGI